MSRKHTVLAATFFMAVTLSPLSAHTLRLFASVEGAQIIGYGYFNGSNRAMQVPFTVTGPDGEPLYSGVTDDQGQFAFTATRRIDHRIRINSGDGHAADFTVSAAELPDRLESGSGTPQHLETPPTLGKDRDRSRDQENESPCAVSSPVRAGAVAPLSAPPLLVDEAIARQIRPLREQLDSYHNTIWWHDVMGGIGYIIGIAGLAYGLGQHKAGKDRVSS